MNNLADKKILLCVSGSVAAYRAPELARRLGEQGAEVRALLTEGATQLISPLLMQAVTGMPARTGLWDTAAEAAMSHIELARWADCIVISPATANVLARLARGEAGDLLSTVCLASTAPLLVAPAMNRNMWSHAATQQNCATLRGRGVTLVGPESGEQACGDVGEGRMSSVPAIVSAVSQLVDSSSALAGQRVLITAGPTQEPIDPVRYLSNHSTGAMGFALAGAAARAGARVELVAGPTVAITPPGVERVDVVTAEDMLGAVMERTRDCDIFIACAAVADYSPVRYSSAKQKRSNEPAWLELKPAPDVLASVAKLPNPPFLVGFAAETERVEEQARSKLKAKGVDMIVGNQVGNGRGFGDVETSAWVVWQGGGEHIKQCTKSELAQRLVRLIAERRGLDKVALLRTGSAAR
ncbi:bifunctional phosphopantothenoylcysteine decarboxylase/phosphopantothenate--cysteine ligase CoaBC [Candidatus Foliamicus sp.]